jgi:DNA replication protein DnaC
MNASCASWPETAFLERKENVLLLGPPGVGKTHLAIALGTEAIVAGSSVYFVTVQDLVQQFQRARDENKLKERMSLLVKPKLLILNGWATCRWTRSPPPASSSWSASATRRAPSS